VLSDATVRRLCAEFGARIRAARKKGRLTPQALGHLVGLSRSSIVNLELGRQRAPVHVVWNLAHALGVSVSDLVPDPETRKAPLKPEVSRVLKQEPRLEDMSSGAARRVREFVAAKLGEVSVEPSEKEG